MECNLHYWFSSTNESSVSFIVSIMAAQLLTVKTIRGNRTAMHYGILSVTDAAEISFSNWNQLLMLSLHWTLKLKC